MVAPTYTYGATAVRIVDGDTIQLDVDLGFHLYGRMMFRLVGYDAPERSTPGFEEARDELIRLTLGKNLVIRTHKGQTFGRWLCEIFVNGESVNARMQEFLT